MNANKYLQPAWIQNNSIRIDLPLMVVPKADKKKIVDMVNPGQLVCVGDIYLKTHNGLVRIKAA
jgi:hypothetical protein